MSSTTPTLGLTLYDASTDTGVAFSTARSVLMGPATSSNMYKIDTAIGDIQADITSLEGTRGAVRVSAVYISANYYEATVASITAYTTGMSIILSVDTTSDGTVTLKINSLDIKSLMKVNSTGTPINLTGSDLVVGRFYLFTYDGSRWLWVSSNSADQIQIVGTSGNVVTVGSTNNLVGTTTPSALLDTAIHAATGKTTPHDNDEIGIVDTEASNVLKKLTWSNLKATLKTYFDSLTTTLTNKRITPRVTSIVSSATPTINTDSCDFVDVTALAAAITSMTTNLSGTPTNGQKLIIRFKDDGTARAITWGTGFDACGVALPTTTIISKRLTVGFLYDTTTSKWGCVASVQEA